jgi:hypothetical protein
MRLIDLTDHRFGRLRVLRRDQRERPRLYWDCLCDCGTRTSVRAAHLRYGLIRSCGCFGRERVGDTHRTHGMSKSPEYRTWAEIKKRCYNPMQKSYARYGGRGITMCDRWRDSFETFYADVGPRPSPRHSIDRMDNTGHYTPENCRWATVIQQANNKRSNRSLTLQGITRNVTQWAAVTGLQPSAIWHRLARGWSDERTLTEPLHRP